MKHLSSVLILITCFLFSNAQPVKKTTSKKSVFNKTEKEATFPGGQQNWAIFLQKNLNPSIPVNNGAPAGSYTVIIQFIVDKKGEISDVTATTNHGYGMEAECIRVIKKTGLWVPAMQNGKAVNAYRRQPITFQIEDEYIDDKDSTTQYSNDATNELEIVEEEAGFPGGDMGWRRFLEKTLNPNVPTDKGAPAGTYKVMVQFTIAKDGNLSNITALTKHGYGMEEEVIKTIKKSGKWVPGKYKGKAVNSYRRQPVTFVIEANKKKK
jgi:hypothetical protein